MILTCPPFSVLCDAAAVVAPGCLAARLCEGRLAFTITRPAYLVGESAAWMCGYWLAALVCPVS